MTMEHPDPRARTTDPGTSHTAAEHVAPRTQTIRAAVLETLAVYAGPKPFTLLDVVGWYARRAANGRAPVTTDSSVRTRVCELVRDKTIHDTGFKATVDGHRPMTLWAVTLDGGD